MWECKCMEYYYYDLMLLSMEHFLSTLFKSGKKEKSNPKQNIPFFLAFAHITKHTMYRIHYVLHTSSIWFHTHIHHYKIYAGAPPKIQKYLSSKNGFFFGFTTFFISSWLLNGFSISVCICTDTDVRVCVALAITFNMLQCLVPCLLQRKNIHKQWIM